MSKQDEKHGKTKGSLITEGKANLLWVSARTSARPTYRMRGRRPGRGTPPSSVGSSWNPIKYPILRSKFSLLLHLEGKSRKWAACLPSPGPVGSGDRPVCSPARWGLK